MYFPEDYIKTTKGKRPSAKQIINRFKDELSWNDGEHILDVGCGPGYITSWLSHYESKKCNVVGCDISNTMINYATDTYSNDRVQFELLDIEDPNNLWIKSNKESFDKILSFYCLHWIKDQRQATKNMSYVLKKNGKMLVLFPVYHPFVVLWKEMPKFDKWKPFLKPWLAWDNSYLSDNEKKEKYIKILEDTNFKIITSTFEEDSYIKNSIDEHLEFFDAINPFRKDLPQDKYEELLEDCKQYSLSNELFTMNSDGKSVLKQKCIVVLAEKI